MRDFPIVAKAVFNIILYILYVVFVSLAFSFIFPLVLQLVWSEVIDPLNNMMLYDKIAIFIALLVLLISVIFRKYFYLTSPQEIVAVEQNSYTQIKKTQSIPKSKTSKKTSQTKADLASDDEEIKIYVEKEIK